MHERIALWTMVGVIVGFKFATLVVILIVAWPIDDSQWGFLVATHWQFLLPLVILAGPALFWLRLLRARLRRERFRRGEWDLS